jgi:Ser/Thr protein kinase RdoA (MazF antagonist)
MTLRDLDLAPWPVLGQYPLLSSRLSLWPLGNRGGFSGALLWRVEEEGFVCCLKAWPPRTTSPEQLKNAHALMRQARDAGLLFVPAVFITTARTTWVEHGGRLWDLTTWLPGRADEYDQPSRVRLEAACEALARLHGVWAVQQASQGTCPAVGRRLACYREWQKWLPSGWRPLLASQEMDSVHAWAGRAWQILRVWDQHIPTLLAPWLRQPLPLQPCLCDIWHDHVLFEGDTVAGIVDYGSVKMDHVAVDLARLLGSLVGDNEGLRAAGLKAYERYRPLTLDERRLVKALDVTGTLVGAVNWLKWIYLEERSFEDRQAVAARLAAIVQRIERWPIPV